VFSTIDPNISGMEVTLPAKNKLSITFESSLKAII
jgi:hypothetical protein